MTNPLITKTKQDLHLTRKIWHAFAGVTGALLYLYYIPKNIFLLLLAVLTGLYLSVEIIRKLNPRFHKELIQNWKWFLRDSEIEGVNTGLYYNLSCFIAIAFFPKTIAVLSIFYLALADPLAAFVGTLWGKKSIQIISGKSLIGSFAAFLVCFLVTIVFLRDSIPFNQLLLISLIGGMGGSLSESLPLKIDDNLTIPIISGLILWGSSLLFKIPIF